jgi:hypothetical protein
MPRIYAKKEDAKREKVTVPVSSVLLDRLKQYAVRQDVSHTQAARRFIETGLDREKQDDKHR